MSKPKSPPKEKPKEKPIKEYEENQERYIINYEELGREHIRSYIGKTVVITGYDVTETKKGTMVVMYILDNDQLKEVFTFSRVVKRQLDSVSKQLEKSNIRAKICYNEKGRYFYLRNPEREC